METKYNLKIKDIKDIWQLSESTDEFMDYVESRLLGKSKEPVFDSRVGEIPEDFLEEAFKQDNEGSFRHQLRNVVKKLLFSKLEFDAEDVATLEYVSRLVYLAEVIELESVFPVIFRFVLCPEYKNRPGIHTADIYVQFLRALAQLQPPMDLSGFWVKRFYDDDYIQYAQPLFTGLRRSSLEHTGLSLLRLFFIADNYPEFFDKNRALRPLIKVCQDTRLAQLLAKGFSSLPTTEQKKVMDAISKLDSDLIQPLETILKSYHS